MTTRYQTRYSVSIACDANAFPEPTNFDTDSKGAQQYADTLVKMLTLSAEPLPAVPGHGPDWTTYTVSSVVPHETFGNRKTCRTASSVTRAASGSMTRTHGVSTTTWSTTE
jgi:glyoxylase-like metal-dependent hydrolase (beta-lactamase superfamily II)